MLPRKSHPTGTATASHGHYRARWTMVGLLGGIACGLIFGEYCAPLSVVGEVFIGLLQMTVLPRALGAIAKEGRYDAGDVRLLDSGEESRPVQAPLESDSPSWLGSLTAGLGEPWWDPRPAQRPR
jgi:hypothetical protein